MRFSRIEELLFVKKEKTFITPTLFSKRLSGWHGTVILVRIKLERQWASAMGFWRVGRGRQERKFPIAPVSVGVMNMWAVDASAGGLLRPHSWSHGAGGRGPLLHSAHQPAVLSPGIIAHVCFLSFPDLGECSRKGPAAVWWPAKAALPPTFQTPSQPCQSEAGLRMVMGQMQLAAESTVHCHLI